MMGLEAIMALRGVRGGETRSRIYSKKSILYFQ